MFNPKDKNERQRLKQLSEEADEAIGNSQWYAGPSSIEVSHKRVDSGSECVVANIVIGHWDCGVSSLIAESRNALIPLITYIETLEADAKECKQCGSTWLREDERLAIANDRIEELEAELDLKTRHAKEGWNLAKRRTEELALARQIVEAARPLLEEGRLSLATEVEPLEPFYADIDYAVKALDAYDSVISKEVDVKEKEET